MNESDSQVPVNRTPAQPLPQRGLSMEPVRRRPVMDIQPRNRVVTQPLEPSKPKEVEVKPAIMDTPSEPIAPPQHPDVPVVQAPEMDENVDKSEMISAPDIAAPEQPQSEPEPAFAMARKRRRLPLPVVAVAGVVTLTIAGSLVFAFLKDGSKTNTADSATTTPTSSVTTKDIEATIQEVDTTINNLKDTDLDSNSLTDQTLGL